MKFNIYLIFWTRTSEVSDPFKNSDHIIQKSTKGAKHFRLFNIFAKYLDFAKVVEVALLKRYSITDDFAPNLTLIVTAKSDPDDHDDDRNSN